MRNAASVIPHAKAKSLSKGKVMSNVANDKLLLSPREAARMLSVSERTLWGLMKEKKIEVRRIGRLTRYPLDGLRRFADGEER